MTKIKHFSRNNKLLLAILLLIVIIACTDITTDPINDMNDSPVISDFNFSAGDTIKFLDSTFFAFQFLATDPNKNKLTVNAQIDSGLAEISLLTHNPDKNGLVKGLFKPGKIGTYLIGINVSDGIKQETKSFPIYFYRNKLPKAIFKFTQLTNSSPYQYEFDASESYDPDGQIINYTWLFPNEIVTGQDRIKFTKSFEDAGTFLVKLKISDSDNDSDSTQVSLITNNKRPIIKLNITPKSGSSPLTISYSGDGSFDTDGSIITTKIDFGDGSDPVSKLNGTYTYISDGIYPLKFTLTDNYNLSADTTIIIKVENSPPAAVLELSDTKVSTNTIIDYDASGSSDIDGSIQSFIITTSNDQSFTAPKGSLQFSIPGTYAIKLVVTDNKGATSEVFKYLEVINTAPIVDFTYNLNSQTVPATITLSPNVTDPDGDELIEFKWDLSESIITKANPDQVTYQFNTNGLKLLRLTVKDKFGASSFSEHQIVLGNGIPTATLTLSSTQSFNNQYVTLTADGIDPDGGSIKNFTFVLQTDTGDLVLNSTSEKTLQYLINNPVGTIKFGLTVLDDENDWSAQVTKTLIVKNSDPIAQLDIPETTKLSPFILNADASSSHDLDPGDQLEFRYYLNDQLINTSPVINHTINAIGTHHLRLDVFDNHGDKTSITNDIVVLSNPPHSIFILSPDSAKIPFNLTLNASSSFDDDPNDNISNYRWVFSDGSSTITGSDKSLITKTVNIAGEFSVTLIVTDNYGITHSSTKQYKALGGLGPINFTISPPSFSKSNSLLTFTAATEGLSVYNWYYSLTGSQSDKVLIKSVLTNNSHSWTNNLPVGDLSFFLQAEANEYTSPLSEFTYQIINTAPTAKLSIDSKTGFKPLKIHYNANKSQDIDLNQTLKFEWLLNNKLISTNSIDSTIIDEIGTHLLTLKVSDDFDESTSITEQIIVNSNPPIASFTFTPLSGNAPIDITLNATSSSDPDGDELNRYEWDFGDGTTLSGTDKYFITHKYSYTGIFKIRLRVRDEHNVFSQWYEQEFNATNTKPNAILSIDPFQSQVIGKPITLDGSSSSDPNGTIQTFIFTYQAGANAPIILSSTNNSSLTVSNINFIGTLNFGLKVVDSDNDTSALAIKSYQIINSPPVAVMNLSRISGAVPYSILADASSSYDPSPDQVLSYQWFLDDELVSTLISDSLKITTPGNHTVKLNVTDNYNASNSDTKTVTGNSNPPVAAFTKSSSTGTVPFSIFFNALSSYDPDPDDYITNYAWNMGDGSTYSGLDKIQVNHTYTIDGDFVITLTVTDQFSKTNSTSQSVQISGGILPSTFTINPTQSSKSGSVITFTAATNANYEYNWYYSIDNGITKQLIQTISNNSSLVFNNKLPVGTLNFYLQMHDPVKNYTSNFSQQSYIILNNNPTADLLVNPLSGQIPFIINYDASGSSDPDINDKLTYQIFLNNVLIDTAKTGSLNISSTGDQTLKLTVNDKFGGSASTQKTIQAIGSAPTASFTMSPQTGFHPLQVVFDASASTTNDGTITDYSWNFGDGTIQSGISKSIVNKTYTSTGTFTVTLKITNSFNLSNVTTKQIIVKNSQPEAIFTIDPPTSQIIGKPITLNGSASSDPNGSIETYIYSYKTGTNPEIILSTGHTPTISISNLNLIGTLNILLRVIDSDNDTSAAAIKTYQIVNSDPVAIMNLNRISGAVPYSIFADASSSYDPSPDQILSYQWYLDDELVSTLISDSLKITTPGTHTIKLNVTDNYNASNSDTKTVTGNSNPPVAAFTKSSTSGTIPYSISFSAASSFDPDPEDHIINYTWNMGDGTVYTGLDKIQINHTFNSEGDFDVTLTVTDQFSKSNSTSQTVNILGGLLPSSFTINPALSSKSGSVITFTAATNANYEYSWYYSLDNGATKQLIQTVVNNNALVFNDPFPVGSINFYLQMYDPVKNYTSAFSQQSYIILNNPPVANLTVSPLSGQVPFIINFNASNSFDSDPNSNITYSIYLNDILTDTIAIGSINIDKTGDQIIKLIVSDEFGSVSIIEKTIQAIGSAPTASFTLSPQTGFHPLPVVFDASASTANDGTITNYSWNFGDGTVQSGISKSVVNKIFTSTGTYNVSLTVTNSFNQMNVLTKQIIVKNSKPEASFTIDPQTTQIIGKPITLNGSASSDQNGSIEMYLYSYKIGSAPEVIINSGHTSTISISDINFIGTLNILLRVVDSDNDTSAVAIKSYQIVNSDPVAIMNLNRISGAVPYSILADASSSYDPSPDQVLSYQWYLDDELVSTLISDSLKITTPGTHTIKLNVTDNYNASNSDTKTVSGLSNPPIADFTKSSTTGTIPYSISFNATSSYDPDPEDHIVNYAWNMGDGTVYSGLDKIQINHTFNSEGDFDVTLTVTDQFSKTNSISQTVNILGGLLPSPFTINPVQSSKSGSVITFTATTNANYEYSWYYSLDNGITKQLIQTISNNNSLVFNAPLPVGTLNFYLQMHDPVKNYTSNFSQQSYIILNNNPTADLLVNPLSGQIPFSINYDASNSNDPDPNDELSYQIFLNNILENTSPVGSLNITSPGNQSIKVLVSDKFGGSSSKEIIVTSIGAAPIAIFSLTPSTGFHPLLIVVDATASTTTDGTITKYYWNFGDGTIQYGADKSVVSKTYNQTGIYNISLTVTNSFNLVNTISKQLIVNNKKPVANFSLSSHSFVAGVDASVNSSTSTDQNGSISSYTWLIDGILVKETTATTTILPLNVSVGSHTISLIVTDNENLDSDPFAETITVTNSAPIPIFDIDNTNSVSTLTFHADASSSYDLSPDQTISYQWFLDDNLIGSSKILDYTLNVVGVHTLKLVVKDNLNLSAFVSQSLTVQSSQPSADFTISSTSNPVPATVSFDASISSDPDIGDMITDYAWDFGDGSPLVSGGTKKFVTHTFSTQGFYLVTLTVTDNYGLKNSKQLGFQATNGIPVAEFEITPANTSKAFTTLLFDASASVDPGIAAQILTMAKTSSDFQLKTQLEKSNPFNSLKNTKTSSTKSALPAGIVRYNWFYSIDGNTIVPISSIENNPLFIWTAALPVGPVSFYLEVEDNQGKPSPRQQRVYILTNNNPLAKITLSPNTGNNPLTVNFDASLSTDIDLNQILNYQWSLDNIQISNSASSSYTITGIGQHNLLLEVSDNQNGYSSTASTITVLSSPPISVISVDKQFGSAPLTVNFSGSGSSDPDIGDEIKTYSFDFGDGQIQSSSSPSTSHTYSTIGDFTARLEVTDNYNKKNSSQIVISVGNSNPISQLTVSPVTSSLNNKIINLNGSSSFDPTGDPIVRYKFSVQSSSDPKTTLYDGTNDNFSFTLNQTVGTITFYLEVEDLTGGISTEINQTYIVLNSKPQANFTLNTSTGTSGFSFTATNTSTDIDPNDPLSYSWYLDNVFVANTQNFTGNVSGIGTHVLQLNVTDSHGELHSIQKNLFVTSSPPTSDFTMSSNSSAIPVTISLDGTLSSDPDGETLTYQWNFGDGSPLITGSSYAQVTHNYTTVGVFTVSLKVTDQSNLTNTSTKTFTALTGVPVPSFTLSASTFKNSDLVTLDGTNSTASGSANIIQYSWYYQLNSNTPVHLADNNIPVYIYDPNLPVGPGGKIGLSVTDDIGSSSTILYQTILVQNSNPQASISVTPKSGQGVFSISFNANSSSDIDPNHSSNFTYEWSFDGIPISTLSSDVYQINKSINSYSLSLKVTDPEGGFSTISESITVNSRPPIASFTATPSSGSAPLSVFFDANASSDPDIGDVITKYRWNYNDGSALESSNSYVTRNHTFSNQGTYQVELQVTDNYNLTHSLLLPVIVTNGIPTANFTLNSTSKKNGESVVLNGSTSTDDGSINNYHWKMEYNSQVFDITTTTTPTYTYTVNMPVGLQRLGLIVEDNQGALSTIKWLNFTVQNTNPVSSFTLNPTNGLNPLQVTISPTSTDVDPSTTFTYLWELDNITVIPVSNKLTVSGIGNHALKLTTTDNSGGSHYISKSITVNNNIPNLTISSNVSTGSIPLSVNFTATGTDPDGQTLTYSWNFGDGTSSTTQNPSQNYTSTGTFTAECTISDGLSTVKKTKVITVTNTAPSLTINSNLTYGNIPLIVSFTATGTDPDGQTLTYSWDFGDGTNSTSQNPSHNYTATGTFVATCTVSDGYLTNNKNISITTVNDDGDYTAFTSNISGFTPSNPWRILGSNPMLSYSKNGYYSLSPALAGLTNYFFIKLGEILTLQTGSNADEDNQVIYELNSSNPHSYAVKASTASKAASGDQFDKLINFDLYIRKVGTSTWSKFNESDYWWGYGGYRAKEFYLPFTVPNLNDKFELRIVDASGIERIFEYQVFANIVPGGGNIFDGKAIKYNKTIK